MELENLALTVIFITLLIARLVESAGDKGTGPLLAPSTLQQVGDQLASTSGSEKIGQVSHESSGEGASSVPEKEDDPIANTSEGQGFVEAVQISDMKAARKIFGDGNNERKKYCGKYLVSLGSARLVELIKGAWNNKIKEWLLQILLVHADQSVLDNVFGAVKPSNRNLKWAAGSAELACLPQRFAHLLKKINDKDDQKMAVSNGIIALIDENRAECFDPLLSALNEGTFLSEDLENVAIRRVFWAASRYQDDRALLAKRYVDHPAISAMDYSISLCNSYRCGDQVKEFFRWLLARADRRDLEVAKRSDAFFKMQPAFQKAVNDRRETVGSKTREVMGREERNTHIKEALDEYVPKDLLKLFSEYI
jgi:hypothetical protein